MTTDTTNPSIDSPATSLASTGQLAPAPQPRAQQALPWKPARILIADDEHLAALSVKQCLAELGYSSIGPARDGEHAIELAFSERPDLALLDVRMSDDFDGIDAARLLFEELRIPSVIVSAYSDARQVAESTVPGVFGYVVKPITCEQLRPAIEVAWARMRQHVAQDDELRSLRKSLEARDVVDRAKWLLVERLEIDEGAALRHLRKQARLTRRSIADVAREVLAT